MISEASVWQAQKNIHSKELTLQQAELRNGESGPWAPVS